MAKYLLFRDYNSFDPELFDYVNSVATYKNKDFYIVTPRFSVASFQNDSTVIRMTLKFKNMDFISFIKKIDSLSMLSYHRTKGVSIEDLHFNFNQTCQLNALTGETSLINFEIPVKGGKPLIKVYDECEDSIPLDIVDINFKGRAIIHPRGLTKENLGYTNKWKLNQIKVEIPEVYFDKCVLPDNNEEVQIF